MKRNIYFLVLLMSLFSLKAFSQSLTLKGRYNNTPIANNDTLTVRYQIAPNVYSWDSLTVTNTTPSKINVMVKKTQRRIVPGTFNSMCWGVCIDSSIHIAGPLEMSGNTSATDFVSEYDPNNKTGISIIRYTFYLETNSNDSICFNIRYIHPPNYNGIIEYSEDYLFSNIYPNPVNNIATINYSYSSDVNVASIVIVDLLGKVVKNISLSNNQGKISINTSDISDGIYLCSLRLDGKTFTTRKFTVNH